MAKKVRWGILGCAKIAIEQVIPAWKKAKNLEVTAIASRNEKKAEETANLLGIPHAYGSYEQLIGDPEIDAVYIPLPNHLHVEWCKKTMQQNKHVLCEKPIALKKEDIQQLISLRDQQKVKIGEAFMVRSHPQWTKAKEIINSGELGKLCSIMGFFSFYNRDPQNYRNHPQFGGGSAWDIGCYPIFTSRFIYGEEPKRVFALMEHDPEYQIDRLDSVILDYPSGQAIFTCSTQIVPYQRMQFFGTKKRLEIQVPFNAQDKQPSKIFIDDGDLLSKNFKTISIPTCNQYTNEGEMFSLAILDNENVPVPLENSYYNCAVIEAAFRSSQTGKWKNIKPY